MGEDGGKEWDLVAVRQRELNSVPNPPAWHGSLMISSENHSGRGGQQTVGAGVVKRMCSGDVDREERRC